MTEEDLNAAFDEVSRVLPGLSIDEQNMPEAIQILLSTARAAAGLISLRYGSLDIRALTAVAIQSLDPRVANEITAENAKKLATVPGLKEVLGAQHAALQLLKAA